MSLADNPRLRNTEYALRKHAAENRARAAGLVSIDGGGHDLLAVENGVTAHWLKAAFRMDADHVRRRLENCPVKGIKRGNIKVYDLATAARYLVDPAIDLEKYLRGLKPADLPANLQPAIWAARLKQQTWEARAGELWPTERVLDVLTEVSKTIRQSMQLWVDQLTTSGVTDSQRNKLTSLVDALQNEIYLQLVQMPKMRATESQLAEIEGEIIEDDDDGIV